MVTKTLRHGILISTDTSKESAYYADLEYTRMGRYLGGRSDE
jgi:hypothetical protein